jgi:hypothetical protein
LRNQIVQKDERCGQLPYLVCFLVERRFCGCDQQAAVEGSLPRGINIERLRDPDPNWTRQFQELGLDPH